MQIFVNLLYFKGERLHDDHYIKLYKLVMCMAMQKKVWMTSFLLKNSFISLKDLYQVAFLNPTNIIWFFMGMVHMLF
jgi:hypothetical protein